MRGLGHVNVVCGKNNSGKSTVLAAIVSDAHRSPGVLVDSGWVDELHAQLIGAGGWGNRDPRSFESQELRRILHDVLVTPRVMFLSEAQLLQRDIEVRFARSQLSQWAFSSQPASRVFASRARNDVGSVLVDAKRSLPIRQPVSAGESVSASGTGLLNFLFFASNQPQTSVESQTFEKIKSAFGEISGGYEFRVFINVGNELDLRFAQAGGDWIPASECGLGLRDLLVCLYFAVAPGFLVVAIEEPENHLHPEMQRRLLGFISRCHDRQFFISTHSNVFLNNAFADRVFLTTFDGQVRLSDSTSRASLLDDLGYSVADNLLADVIVLTEGPSDIAALEELLVKAGVFPRFSVKMWPLGGDIMDQVDLSVFTQASGVIALIDKDPGSKKTRDRFKKQCEDKSIPVVQLERYSIENYLSLSAYKRVFGSQIPASLHEIAPDQRVEDQIHLNPKRSLRKLARETDYAEIERTDLGRFIARIAELAQSTPGGR